MTQNIGEFDSRVNSKLMGLKTPLSSLLMEKGFCSSMKTRNMTEIGEKGKNMEKELYSTTKGLLRLADNPDNSRLKKSLLLIIERKK